MPWGISDVEQKTKKASTPRLKRMWVHVANSHLADHPDDEAGAIERANGVVKKYAESAIDWHQLAERLISEALA